MERLIKSKTSYLSYSTVYFCYFFSMGIFSSILSLYLAGNGKSAAEIAFVVSGAGIFTMVMQPFIGMVYDRMQRDSLVSIVLLALSGISGLLFAWGKSTLMLFLLNGFAMAFLNGVSPICERMATESKYRYGSIRAWGSVGFAVATQIAGIIFDHFPPRVMFYLFAATAALTMLGFRGVGAGKARVPVDPMEKAAPGDILRSLLRNKPFLLFAATSFLFSGTAGTSSTYLPLLLEEQLGSITGVGTILFLGTLMELPLILFSGKFMDRLSGKTLLALNYGLLFIQYLCYSFSSTAWLTCAVLFFCKSTATMLFIMVTLKLVLNLTDAAPRPRPSASWPR